MKELTIEQAYKAMFYFLEDEYNATKSDELGGLLGSLSWEIFVEPGPADPSAWEQWIEAVDKALAIKEEK